MLIYPWQQGKQKPRARFLCMFLDGQRGLGPDNLAVCRKGKAEAALRGNI